MSLPTNPYSTGLPAPPRILIPPPTINASPDSSSSSSEWSAQNLSHLITQTNSIIPNTLQDWKYEFRREAQQLLPHLYLGPLSAAKDSGFLAMAGITQLIAIRNARTRLGEAANVAGIKYFALEVNTAQELIRHFNKAVDIIDMHYIEGLSEDEKAEVTLPLDGRTLKEKQIRWMTNRRSNDVPGGRTLLFCESGNDRSAVVAAAYIMQHLGANTVQSIQVIQGRRFCVCFNDELKWMLNHYEPIWRARPRILVGVIQQKGTVQQKTGGNRKRALSLDEDDEEMVVMGKAPFSDTDIHAEREEDVVMG
ncbi:protein-tyrosine phosphatase-like protein [Pyronema omphalodes]|nr:protein-tyrosine phosphatase-like protein [Pyronema omphalodes]